MNLYEEIVTNYLKRLDFEKSNLTESEIVYDDKRDSDRFFIVIHSSLSNKTGHQLLDNGNAFRISIMDHEKARVIGRTTKIFHAENWQDRLAYEVERFAKMIENETWKKCPECGEPMRFIDMRGHGPSFWGCNGYINRGEGCQYRELIHDHSSRTGRNVPARKVNRESQDAGVNPKGPKPMRYRSYLSEGRS